MRHPWLAVAVALLPGAAWAQVATPVAELFGGYSYSRSDGQSLHGWESSLALNLSGWLGVAADVSGHYGSVTGGDFSRLAFLAGPRLSRRRGDLTLFVHALAGGVRTSTGVTVLGVSITASHTDAGGALGGGFDFKLRPHWALRIQGDVLATRAEGETSTGPRLAAGVVYRAGARSASR